MYQPFRQNSTARQSQQISFMGKGGVNLRDLPQLMTPQNSLVCQNYYVTADGSLQKREGYTVAATRSGSDGVLMLKNFQDNILFAYANKLEAFNRSTGIYTTINTFSSNSNIYNGVKYGDYFFITNNTDKIGKVTFILNYDNQTANFTEGNTITGATSGATAIILEDADAGTSGVLTLGSVNGVFLDNEIITDETTGSATVDGVIGFAYTTITDAPICRNLFTQNGRLFALGLKNDPTAVAYSAKDIGTNPPFENWTVGTDADDPGELSNRNAGQINSAFGLGDNVIILADNGKWGFFIDTIDSGGTLVKIDRPVFDRQDFGSARAAQTTPKGSFYANKAGLWNLISVGQPNIPYSDQEQETDLLLGNKFFDNLNLENSDLIYDAKRKLILLTCAQDSSVNNFILVYNTEFQSFTFFTGWNINRFLQIGDDLYGASSVTNQIFKLFDSNADNGSDIWTVFTQELSVGSLNTIKELQKFWIHGFLSISSNISVSFDIYNRNGILIKDKLIGIWKTSSSDSSQSGWGVSSWGRNSWGGDSNNQGLVESFNGWAPSINNFQRLRVTLRENSTLPHQISWFSMVTKEKSLIRRRGIQNL